MSTIIRVLTGILAAMLIAGCASYDGRNLIAGTSTAADVAASMGVPAEKVALPNGDTVWQYPHGPLGRETYGVRIGKDSVVKEVKQLLTEENIARIVAKQSTRDDVKALIGPPHRVTQFSNLPREVWEYALLQDLQARQLYVQFTPDGKVGEVQLVTDPGYVFMGDSGN
jgi:hypothetical protein